MTNRYSHITMSNPPTRQWPADSHINSSVPMWTSKVMSHSLSQSQHGDSRENDGKGYFQNVTKCPFKQGGGSSTWKLCLVICIEASQQQLQQFWNRLLKVNVWPTPVPYPPVVHMSEFSSVRVYSRGRSGQSQRSRERRHAVQCSYKEGSGLCTSVTTWS